MKTKEELNALKEKEVESESKERQKLTDEELAQVSGGALPFNDQRNIVLSGVVASTGAEVSLE